MNAQISMNLAESGFETRPTGGNGLWCLLLIPIIFTINTKTYDVSPVYKVSTVLSLGLFFYSIIFIISILKSCSTLKETTIKGASPISLISAVIMSFVTNEGLHFCLLLSFASLHSYSYLLRHVLKEYPKTFTIGEAIIVTNSIVLFVTSSMISKYINSSQINEEESFFHTIIFTILTTVILIITALYYLKEQSRNVTNLVKIIVVAALFEIILLLLILGPTAVPKLFSYLFSSYNRVKILMFWVFLVVIAVLVLILQTSLNIKADTSTRKTFHILASAVFLTGLLADFKLMMLASGIGLALLILVEALRKSRIEPISNALQSAFITYSDEKDCGAFAMTPIYLFCGLACPIVLVPGVEGFSLELLSGVLSIGVGDTAASFFGSRYGRIKWPGSNKTIEGMVCNALSQILLVMLLDYFAVLPLGANISRTAIAASISALVEINTDQVDNLILPLVMFATYRVTNTIL